MLWSRWLTELITNHGLLLLLLQEWLKHTFSQCWVTAWHGIQQCWVTAWHISMLGYCIAWHVATLALCIPYPWVCSHSARFKVFKLFIMILDLSLIILPLHLRGLNGLIGAIDSFFEFKFKIGPCTDKL